MPFRAHAIRGVEHSGLQAARVPTGDILPAGAADVAVAWPMAFADTNYAAEVGLEDSSRELRLDGFTKAAGSLSVRVRNTGVLVRAGVIHAVAFHD